MSSNTEELEELFYKPKCAAVAMFRNDHDDGDTALYHFIREIIPLIQSRESTLKAEYEEKVKRLTVERDGWRKRSKAWRRDVEELEIEYLEDVEEKVRQARINELRIVDAAYPNALTQAWIDTRIAELSTPKNGEPS